ncbi:MAG: hypothetical protein IT483_15775 [Gammaproteobacteria bacterium]|nr:hypothetical protein [Gammaproteobacteria bacterium]
MKSLHACMVDPDLFGRTFGGPTFSAWRTVAKILDGLPLDDGEHELFRQVTGRTEAPLVPFSEAYLVKPRRAGGTLFGAACGVHAALQDYRDRLGPGEWATVALIASDRRQARQLMGYVKGLIADSPIILAEVVNETAESIELAHRARLEVHVASFRSTRGYSYAAVLLDELAFYRDDQSASPDVELVRAVRPGLANLGGRLLGFSSPHSRRGHLWEMYRSHYGRDASDVLVIQAPGRVLNPTIKEGVIARARAEDPTAARSEWDAQFREDVAQFLVDSDIDRAVEAGVVERPMVPARNYVAFVDPSGGRHDAMTLAIAHPSKVAHAGAEGRRLTLDRLLIVHPPFDPETVVQRFTEALRAFGLKTVTGDRYAAEWVSSAFSKYGIQYRPSDLDKSAIYVEVLPHFAQGLVELLDIPTLLTQLRLLERRPRAGGRGDAVDHPPRASDDAANAACGAIWLASRVRPERLVRPPGGFRAITDYDELGAGHG